ncbi:conserved hypothetical protein [Vibrio nigripulchritudo MADA3029]|uniref:hypothetical protein n=1 Tax=Vibrio nigripulchritudo TaxID=28173 RepID=UPI0003B19DBD|nr:hypothetical protein [Vibrio nigripulchritudo]CCN50461.1 conserved hypothetical protein [Vibrio nigripulchritudo MADA3020]CCN52412.1 conserved hypothetical protein [Vibrio nigripulchritudo MADA3021]CCN62239.1 conserved hypothetical protein [Vibrio nigripulchritudo MADA3029]
MPIAICYARQEILEALKASPLVEIWAQRSQKDGEHMTVNFIKCEYQKGNPYKILVDLKLPSLWNQTSRHALALGLSQALSVEAGISETELLVTVNVIESGCVVSNGQIETW